MNDDDPDPWSRRLFLLSAAGGGLYHRDRPFVPPRELLAATVVETCVAPPLPLSPPPPRSLCRRLSSASGERFGDGEASEDGADEDYGGDAVLTRRLLWGDLRRVSCHGDDDDDDDDDDDNDNDDDNDLVDQDELSDYDDDEAEDVDWNENIRDLHVGGGDGENDGHPNPMTATCTSDETEAAPKVLADEGTTTATDDETAERSDRPGLGRKDDARTAGAKFANGLASPSPPTLPPSSSLPRPCLAAANACPPDERPSVDDAPSGREGPEIPAAVRPVAVGSIGPPPMPWIPAPPSLPLAFALQPPPHFPPFPSSIPPPCAVAVASGGPAPPAIAIQRYMSDEKDRGSQSPSPLNGSEEGHWCPRQLPERRRVSWNVPPDSGALSVHQGPPGHRRVSWDGPPEEGRGCGAHRDLGSAEPTAAAPLAAFDRPPVHAADMDPGRLALAGFAVWEGGSHQFPPPRPVSVPEAVRQMPPPPPHFHTPLLVQARPQKHMLVPLYPRASSMPQPLPAVPHKSPPQCGPSKSNGKQQSPGWPTPAEKDKLMLVPLYTRASSMPQPLPAVPHKSPPLCGPSKSNGKQQSPERPTPTEKDKSGKKHKREPESLPRNEDKSDKKNKREPKSGESAAISPAQIDDESDAAPSGTELQKIDASEPDEPAAAASTPIASKPLPATRCVQRPVTRDDVLKRSSKYTPRNLVLHNYRDRSDEPPPSPREGRDGPATRGGVIMVFPARLFRVLALLEWDGREDVASWRPHGRAFGVHRPQEFERLWPAYVERAISRHEGADGSGVSPMKFSSFQRQLNLYGFSRISVGQDKGCYYHEMFLRWREFLAHRLPRMRLKGNGSRAAYNPDEEPNFYLMKPVQPLPENGAVPPRCPPPPAQTFQPPPPPRWLGAKGGAWEGAKGPLPPLLPQNRGDCAHLWGRGEGPRPPPDMGPVWSRQQTMNVYRNLQHFVHRERESWETSAT